MITSDEIKLINEEIKGCFDFFWNESNGFEDGPGYGLTLDKTGCDTSSIAAVGFALCSYVIGVKHELILFEQGYERCVKTLHTIKNNIAHKKGFLVHFVNQKTGINKRSEYSTIDTSILLMGAISAGEFFGKEVKTLADELVERVDWEWFVKDVNGKKVISMAYSDERYQDNDGWCKANWDHYAEQLMMYILYAGSKNSNEHLANELYFGFERHIGSYKGQNMVYCHGNALFIHQFTHCFFDFSKYLDSKGCDWFANSVSATLANRQFCIDQKWSKTYNENSWGLTAFQGEHGYRVFGAPPYGFIDNNYYCKIDGSVAPYAALSSMPFTPKESLEALKYFNTIEGLKGKYGLKDSYNFEKGKFISDTYLGIDKGPTIIMLDNFLNGTIQQLFMQSSVCQRAINVLKFQDRQYKNYDFLGNAL